MEQHIQVWVKDNITTWSSFVIPLAVHCAATWWWYKAVTDKPEQGSLLLFSQFTLEVHHADTIGVTTVWCVLWVNLISVYIWLSHKEGKVARKEICGYFKGFQSLFSHFNIIYRWWYRDGKLWVHYLRGLGIQRKHKKSICNLLDY